MIKAEMTIAEILAKHPQTLQVFRSFGLECSECQIADYEDLAHGAGVHNVSIDKLIKALNAAIRG